MRVNPTEPHFMFMQSPADQINSIFGKVKNPPHRGLLSEIPLGTTGVGKAPQVTLIEFSWDSETVCRQLDANGPEERARLCSSLQAAGQN